VQNLDVRGTDQTQADDQTKPHVSAALELCDARAQPSRNTGTLLPSLCSQSQFMLSISG
jgi:hypothetical protein